METTMTTADRVPRLVTPVADILKEIETFFREPAVTVVTSLLEMGLDLDGIAEKLDLTAGETRRMLERLGYDAPSRKARGKQLFHRGLSMTAVEWAKHLDLNYATVRQRQARGYETKWVLYAGEYPRGMSVTYLRLMDMLMYGIESADEEWLANGLRRMYGEKLDAAQIGSRMATMRRRGLVYQAPGYTWALTEAGRRMAMGVAP